eukprot:TRINITY_DN2482_c1_g1_i1.p1 TRINITY_DN2482_c1_g1~~TRINITY_DN2482_c1_g1_i1.p1  ORF type:complete len:631 (-),score=190.91 TRINITY_DN2482_c1_g1_i1:20-1912(-)
MHVNFAFAKDGNIQNLTPYHRVDIEPGRLVGNIIQQLINHFKLNRKEEYYLRLLHIASQSAKPQLSGKVSTCLSLKDQGIADGSHIGIFPLDVHEQNDVYATISPGVTREGWANKYSMKGGSKTGVVKRHFVMSSLRPGLLYYFEKKTANCKPSGVLVLDYYEVEWDSALVIRLKKRESFRANGKDYIMGGDTVKEASVWVKWLKRETYPFIGSIIFGKSLESLANRGLLSKEGVPEVFKKCCESIEAKGLDVQGIMRESASNVTVDEIMEKIDDGIPVTFTNVVDPHVVGGVIKMFLKKLPDPLLTFDLFERFTAASRDPDQIVHLVGLLPTIHQCLLRYLLNFIDMILAHSKQNLMETQALATVFAPNVLRPRVEADLLSATTVITAVFQQVIENRNRINWNYDLSSVVNGSYFLSNNPQANSNSNTAVNVSSPPALDLPPPMMELPPPMMELPPPPSDAATLRNVPTMRQSPSVTGTPSLPPSFGDLPPPPPVFDSIPPPPPGFDPLPPPPSEFAVLTHADQRLTPVTKIPPQSPQIPYRSLSGLGSPPPNHPHAQSAPQQPQNPYRSLSGLGSPPPHHPHHQAQSPGTYRERATSTDVHQQLADLKIKHSEALRKLEEYERRFGPI